MMKIGTTQARRNQLGACDVSRQRHFEQLAGAAAANVGDELKGVNEELIRANGKSGGPAKLVLSD